MDVYFISETNLKANSLITENVDDKLLMPTLIMVQDIYLQPILGTSMYEDFKTKIAASTLIQGEKDLITNYIYKILIYYMQMHSISALHYRFMNKGMMVKNGESSSSASTSDLKVLKDEFRLVAENYAEMLTKYLQQNIATYPLYDIFTETGKNRITTNYTTGIDLNE